MMNRMAAASALLFGIPGFFMPRVPPPQFAPEGTLSALSYYDTEPLRATLEELIDFDRINAGRLRLSLGSVNARTGESIYFDSTTLGRSAEWRWLGFSACSLEPRCLRSVAGCSWAGSARIRKEKRRKQMAMPRLLTDCG